MLYRAAADETTNIGSTCFAARLSDARAYLSNPGFGGATLYRMAAEIDPATVLDARHELPGWLAEAIDAMGAVTRDYALTACESVQAAILEHGFRWVRFIDSYPTDCETWALLADASDDLTDEIEEAMEEVG